MSDPSLAAHILQGVLPFPLFQREPLVTYTQGHTLASLPAVRAASVLPTQTSGLAHAPSIWQQRPNSTWGPKSNLKHPSLSS